MATQRLAQSGQALDHVFNNCTRLPQDFDSEDLLVGDRTFLLFYLRGITHGNEYEFMAKCNNEECGRSSNHVYDLNNLANTITVPKPDLGSEPFKVVLPYLSKVMGKEVYVEVKFLRGKHLNAIMRNRANQRRIAKPTASNTGDVGEVAIDRTLSQNLNLVIHSVLGDTDPNKINKFVERLHARDTATIREWLKDNTPGIDTSISIRCPHCQNDMTIDLPITESFFRPSSSGGPGT